MPGRPGVGGPVPKRSDQVRRRNKPTVMTTKAVAAPAAAAGRPEPDEHWHPIVKELFRSLGHSGQSKFYEPSDWAYARLVCEMAHRGLEKQVLSGQLMATVLAGLTPLLMTEGERRRARIELERADEVPDAPSVALMAKYRKAAGK